MKKLHLLISCLFIFLNSNTNAQSFEWAKKVEGSVTSHSIFTDSLGNVFVIGDFSDTALFETVELTAAGYNDIFIAKYDSEGNLIWVKQAGDASMQGGSYLEAGNSIVADNQGNCYVTGAFRGNAAFETTVLTSAGYQDIFIAKYNSNGNLIWARRAGGVNGEWGQGIALDNKGYVYITGGFLGPVNFGLINLSGYAGKDIFIAKYDTAGTVIWARQAGGPAGNDDSYGISIDNNGNCYITGYYSSYAYFGPFQIGTGSVGFFIAKYNDDGVEQWVKGSSSNNESHGYGVSVDGNGNINLTGSFINEIQFDTITLTGWNPTYENIFIAKYNTNGNILLAKAINSNFLINARTNISSDNIGNSYVSGNFNDIIYIDSTMLAGGGIFISKYDNTGKFSWVKQVHNASTSVIFFDNSFDCIYTTGVLWGSTSFDSIPIVSGFGSMFIAKQKNLKNIIKGKVFLDADYNCIFNSGDFALKNIYVKALPGPYYGITDVYGNYTLFTDTGSYTVTQVTSGLPLYDQDCQLSYNVTLAHPYDSAVGLIFVNKADVYCPKLWVDIGSTNIRRCFDAKYFVHYCNNGTAPVNDVIIKIDFGNDLTPQSSSIPWSNVTGTIYTFNLGNLGIGQCGSFNITVNVSCDDAIMFTQKCVTAIILPDTSCVQPDTAWDRRQLLLTGSCENNGFVRFILKNNHTLNITQFGLYKIYVNNTLALLDSFLLPQGDSMVVLYPANGNTLRFEVGPANYFSPIFNLQVTIEGCGGSTPITGMADQLPEDDYADNYEKDCKIVTGSYDPNDKIGKPVGVTQMHYINQYDELEYQINFQNTGSDTAFKVILIDTISPYLDITSLVSGASSHPYTYNVSGANIAEWTFDNILLPDSNVNLEGSKGFVKYKIQQQPNNPPNTLINNNAAIYFDYNDAVTTNTTSNTVYDTTLLCTEPMPVSNFMFMQNGFDVAFASTSVNTDYYLWFFGDDSISTTSNPWHIYQYSGQYNVCLVSSNNCYCDTFCQIIDIIVTGITDDLNKNVSIYPNPAHDEIILKTENINEDLKIELFNIIGSAVGFTAEKIKDTDALQLYKIDIRNLQKGIYYLKLKSKNEIISKLVVIE